MFLGTYVEADVAEAATDYCSQQKAEFDC